MKLFAVLVRTENPSNIGAAARAVANMGGEALILVDPQTALNSKARQLAAGAQAQIDAARTYAGWDEFYAHEPDGLRIALTRRVGKRRKVLPLKEQLRDAHAAATRGETAPFDRVYLIFGPEADGLNADDLALANYACHLPVHGEFGSLNLAQAVLLALHVTREEFPATDVRQVTGENEPPAQPFYFPDALVKEWLEAMGFDVSARRASAFLTLRRLFMQNRPTQHELQVLESVLQQNIRKLRERAPLSP